MFVKKPYLFGPFLLLIFSLFFFFSCRRVNEATLLGGDLVPEVDNINTFDKSFLTVTDNFLLKDTTKLTYGDPVALGNIASDPEFGQTNAAVYFQVSPVTYGTYPFAAEKENIIIDSVVLSLDYVAGYGDTTVPQTVRVYEIAQSAPFYDTSYYTFDQPNFETTGAELGARTFTMSELNDSVAIVRKTTGKVANQLRITLDNSLGERFISYDTTTSTTNGAYNNDTAFKNLFRGFAIKADEGAGNGLGYFNLSNTTKTRLTIYYQTKKNGTFDTLETAFIHPLRIVDSAYAAGGQANCIKRQPGGGWATYLNNGTPDDDKVYVQSTPGSVGFIKIPELDTFKNKLVHRAELIVTRIGTPLQDWFTAPDQLFLDQIKTDNGKDSAFLFDEHYSLLNQTFDYNSFGGHLRSDNTYRFNITKAVQDIITRDSSNYQLRIYAPFRTAPYDSRIQPAAIRTIPVLPYQAYGRVVLAGGNHTDATMRMRLYVIYSNL